MARRAFGAVLVVFVTLAGVRPAAGEPDAVADVTRPRVIETILRGRGAVRVRSETDHSARAEVLRALGYTLLPGCQIGVELGAGGSLDGRAVSVLALFSRALHRLDDVRIVYVGVRGGGLSHWWLDGTDWSGTVGVESGLKWVLTETLSLDVGVGYEAPAVRMDRGWWSTSLGVSWAVSRGDP